MFYQNLFDIANSKKMKRPKFKAKVDIDCRYSNTFSELGRMYNVTRITIRDHCVNYNFKKLKS